MDAFQIMIGLALLLGASVFVMTKLVNQEKISPKNSQSENA